MVMEPNNSFIVIPRSYIYPYIAMTTGTSSPGQEPQMNVGPKMGLGLM